MSDAWALAERAAADAGVRIGRLEGLRDAAAVDGVIAQVWGEQPVGPELIRAFEHAGAPLLGAWDTAGGRAAALVGYVLGFVGVADGLHVHSHMLAVIPSWRRRGAGFALKLAQRAWAIDAGIDQIRWTFDPMLFGNARFNLCRLGGIGTAFLPNFYGAMQDELNRGERTDRFELVWDTASARVAEALGGPGRGAGRPLDPARTILTSDEAGRPAATGTAPGSHALVAIPPDHLRLRREDPDLAASWRDAAGDAFAMCFEHGLVATSVTEYGSYVFEPPPP